MDDADRGHAAGVKQATPARRPSGDDREEERRRVETLGRSLARGRSPTDDDRPDAVRAATLAMRGWTVEEVETLLGPPPAVRAFEDDIGEAVWWAEDVARAEASTAFRNARTNPPGRLPTVTWSAVTLAERGWPKTEVDARLGGHDIGAAGRYDALRAWREEQRPEMRAILEAERARRAEAETAAQAKRAAFLERDTGLREHGRTMTDATPVADPTMPPDRIDAATLTRRGWTVEAARTLLGPPRAWTARYGRDRTGAPKRVGLWWTDDVEAAERDPRYAALGGTPPHGPARRETWSRQMLRRRGWRDPQIGTMKPAKHRGTPRWPAALAWRIEQSPEWQAGRADEAEAKTRAEGPAAPARRTVRSREPAPPKALATLGWIALDAPGTRLRDDAIAVETLGGGRYRVWVAVADAGGAIAEGSNADLMAAKRTTTIAAPGTHRPLIRSRVAKPRLSLDQGARRRVLVTALEVGTGGVVPTLCMVPATITVTRATTFKTASREALSGQAPWPAWRAAATAIEMDRRRAGGLILGPRHRTWWDGRTIRVSGETPAEQWVAAIMVAANAANGAWLASAGAPGLWRSHGGSIPERIGRAGRPNSALEAWRWRLAVEADAKAHYTTDRRALHAGLGLVSYAHTTSPLRRYADLFMQRTAHRVHGGLAPAPIDEALAGRLTAEAAHAAAETAALISTRAWRDSDAEIGAVLEAVVIAQDAGGTTLAMTEIEGARAWTPEVEAAVGDLVDVKLAERAASDGSQVRVTITKVR